jgi:hypothetical protein
MKHPPGAPMTLGDMRHLGVQRLVATCLNDACRHQGLIDVSKYPGDTEVPWFARKVVCAKCGARGMGRKCVISIDVRPNWTPAARSSPSPAAAPRRCSRRGPPGVSARFDLCIVHKLSGSGSSAVHCNVLLLTPLYPEIFVQGLRSVL